MIGIRINLRGIRINITLYKRCKFINSKKKKNFYNFTLPPLDRKIQKTQWIDPEDKHFII